MLKSPLKLVAKTLGFLMIPAVFLYIGNGALAAVGLSVGHGALNLGQTENLYYGNIGIGSHASSSFLLFQKNAADIFKIDNFGNLTTSGAITAGAFSGPITGGSINAANVSAGAFGANLGGGNYSFPGNVGIGTTNPELLLDVAGIIGAGGNTVAGELRSYQGGYAGHGGPYVSIKTSGTESGIFRSNTDFFVSYNLSSGDTSLNASFTNSNLLFKYQGSEKMRMTSTGNLGIGTTNPQNKLTVVQSSGGSGFGGTDGTGGVRVAWTSGYGVGMDAWDGGSPHWGIVKYSGNTPAVVMEGVYGNNNVLFNAGNVGIGTTNPGTKLTVVGSGNYSIDAGNYRIGNVAAPVVGNDAVTKSYMDSAINSATSSITLWGGNTSGNIWSLNAGNVGLGTSAPTQKLYVEGGIFGSNIYAPSFENFKQSGSLTNKTITPDTTQIAQSPISPFLWHDIFAFSNPAFETSVDGSVWTSATTDKRLFSQKESQSITVLNPTLFKAVRWTWSSGVQYSLANWVVIAHTYSNPAPDKTILIESSPDGSTWTQLHTSTYTTVAAPVWHYIPGIGINSYLRITIISNSGSNVNLSGIRLLTSRWGDQGAGSELSFPYGWDENKNITLSGSLALLGGSSSSLGLKFAADQNTGIYNNGSDYLGMVTGGSERLSILNNGNVGIGTNAPVAKLDIVDGGSAFPATSGSTQSAGLIARFHDSSNLVLDIGGSGGSGAWLQSVDKTGLSTNYPLLLNPNGGNVGIGTTTPSARLSLSGGNVFINDAVITSATPKAAVTKEYLDSSLTAFNTESNLWKLNGNNLYSSSTNWNVGIGTTNPGRKLEIFSNSDATTIAGLKLKNQGTSINTGAAIDFDFFSSDAIGARIASIRTSGSDYESALTFYTNSGVASSTISEAMRIDGSGNVGIGTTNPLSKLTINGGLHVGGDTNAGDNNLLVDGTFRLGELYYSDLKSISLPLGTESWVNLATIPNNGTVRFQVRTGSNNSEEIAEIEVFGTYHIAQTGIEVRRQTYNSHLREVRVTGSDGGVKTVYIRLRTSAYAPNLSWRVIESKGAVTINNIESSPTGGLSLLVDGNLSLTTNTSLNIAGNVGIGTTTPGTKLTVVGSGNYSIDAGNYRVGNVAVPVGPLDAVNKSYMDSAISSSTSSITLWGGNTSGNIFSLNSGNVGIGTTNPTKTFQIGDATNSSSIYNDYIGTVNNTVFESRDSNDGGAFRFRSNSDATTSELVTITRAGNVGIGTTLPGYPLDVVKSDNAYARILATAGNGTSGLIIGSNNLAKWTIGVNNGVTGDGLQFKYAGSGLNALFVKTDGSIGIGTTNPGAKLSLGDTALNPNAAASKISVYDNGVQHFGMGLAYNGSIYGLGLYSYNTSTSDPRVFIGNSGNVGIGTVNPTAKLYVNGTSIFNDIATFTQPVVVATPILAPHAATKGYVDSLLTGGTTAGSFDTLNVAGTTTLATTKGNVGIGTAGPAAKLDVETSSTDAGPWILAAGGSGVFDNAGLRLYDQGTGPGNSNIIEFAHHNTGPVVTARILSDSVGSNAANGSNLIFETASNNTGTWNSNQLFLSSGGSVGIGTTNPQYKIDVSGSARISGNQFNWYRKRSFQVAYRQGVSANSRHEVRIPWPTGQSGTVVLDVEVLIDTDSVSNRHYVKKRFYLTAYAPNVGGDLYFQQSYVVSSLDGNSTNYNYIGTFEEDTANGQIVLPIYSSSSNNRSNSITLTAWGTDAIVDRISNATYASDVQVGIAVPSRAAVQAPPNDDFVFANNVGIGTTAPGTKLTVVGSGNYSIDAGNYRIGNVAVPVGPLDAVNKSYMDSAINSATSSITLWGGSTSGNIYSLNSGNVGIGVVNPGSKLNVASSYSDPTGGEQFGTNITTSYRAADTSLKQGVRLNTISENVTGTLSHVIGLLSLVTNTNTGQTDNATAYWSRVDASGGRVLTNATNFYANTASISGGATIQNQYGLYVAALSGATNNFAVYTNGTTPSYFGGNVGVGTTNPVAKLHISGTNPSIIVRPTNANEISSLYLDTTHNAGGATNNIIFQENASEKWSLYYSTAGNYLGFKTGSAAWNFPSLSILDNTGNVGIGTTTSTSKLAVAGGNAFIHDAVITSGTPKAAVTKEYLDSSLTAFNSENNLWKLGGSNLYSSSTAWNIGVGTASPSEKLTVYSTGTQAYIRVSSPDNAISGIKLGEDQNPTQTYGHRIIYDGNGDYVKFQNIRNTVSNDVMTFNSSGVVTLYNNLNLTTPSFSQNGQNVTNLTMTSDPFYNKAIMGYDYDMLMNADKKYPVTLGGGFSGSSANLFDGNTGTSIQTTVGNTGTIEINFASMQHYFYGLSLNSPWGTGYAFSTSFLIEKYYDPNNANGWDSNCDNSEGDLVWATVADVTGFTGSQYVTRNGLGNGNCAIRVTFRDISGTQNFIQVGDFSIYQFYYGYMGLHVKSNGDRMYGDYELSDGALRVHLDNSTGNSYFNGGSSANFGIGITNPNAKLSVSGGNVFINDAAITSGTPKAAVTKEYLDSSLTAFNSESNLWKLNSNNLSPSSTAWNVGIGTTSPGYKLDVFGGTTRLRLDGAGGQFPLYLWNEQAAAAGVGSGIAFLGGSTNQAQIVSGWNGAATTDAYLRFITRGNNALTESMRITSTGNVGIGTTNPLSLFHAKQAIDAASQANGFRLSNFDDSSYFSFYINSVAGGGNPRFATNKSLVFEPSQNIFLRSYGTAVYINDDNNKNVFIAGGGGYVSMGTTSSLSKLSVSGGNIFINDAAITSGTPKAAITKEYFDSSILNKLTAQRNTSAVDVNALGDNFLLYGGSTSAWLNRGPSGHNGGAILHIPTHTGDYYSDLWFDTSNGRIYTRSVNAGTMGGWSLLPKAGTTTSNYIAKWSGTDTLVNSLLFDNGTNVGVGTTAPPDAKLNVNGTFHVSGALNSVVLDKLSGTGNRIVMVDTGGSLYATSSSVASGLPSASGNGGYTLRSDGTNWVANSNLYNNGTNVGVGLANPRAKLEVASWAEGGRVDSLALSNSGTIDNSATALYMGYQGGGLGYYGARILQVGNPGVTRSSDLLFQIHGITPDNADTSWVTPLMIQRTTGNVGVGTTNPGALLDIVNSSTVESLPFRVNNPNSSTSDTKAVGIDFWGADSVGTAKELAKIVAGTTGIGGYNFVNSNLNFYTRNGNAMVQQMVINNLGNVGIGTLTPGAKLNIVDSGTTWGLLMNNTASDGGVNNWYVGASGSAWGSGDNKFLISPTTTSANASLVIDYTGYIGISTTTTTARLSVSGGNIFINDGVITSATPKAAITKEYLDSAVLNLWSGTKNGNIWNGDTGTGKVGIGTTDPKAKLHVAGGVVMNHTAVADTDYTVLEDDYIIGFTSISTNRTVTIPNDLCTPGRFFVVADESGDAASTKAIIIDPEGTTPVIGVPTFNLTKPYNSVYLFCGNNAWYIL